MVGVVSNPGLKGRLRFGKMIIDGWVKEMFVTGQDPISKFIEINDSIDSLAR